jgi:hypothetical protein
MLGPGMHNNLRSPELQVPTVSHSPEFVAMLHVEDAKLLISLCLERNTTHVHSARFSATGCDSRRAHMLCPPQHGCYGGKSSPSMPA